MKRREVVGSVESQSVSLVPDSFPGDPSGGHTTTPASARRQALVVLGMHRSGTSALTGMLSLLGGRLPKRLLPPSNTNKKGYFESADFVAIHDELLESAGTAWYSWDKLSPSWFRSSRFPYFVDLLRESVLANFDDRSLFLVKDPRISRFFPVWEDVAKSLDAELKVLITTRNPLEVARSLQSRNGLTTSETYLVWLRHVLDAERDTRHLDRAFVRFEELVEDWRPVFDRMVRQLSMSFPRLSARSRREIDEFLSKELRNNAASPADIYAYSDISEWIKGAYTALEALETDPHDGSAMQMLDTIRVEFDRACEAFSAPIEALNAKLARAASTTAGLEAERQSFGPLQSQLDAAQAELQSERHLRAISEAQAAAAELEVVDHHNNELAQRAQRAAELVDELQFERQLRIVSDAQAASVAAQLDAVSRLNADLTQRAQRAEELEAELRSERQLRQTSETKVSSLMAELEATRHELSAMPEVLQLADSRAQMVAALQSRLEASEKEMLRLRAEFATAKALGQGLEKQVNILQAESRQQLSLADAQRRKAQTRVRALRQRVAELRADKKNG